MSQTASLPAPDAIAPEQLSLGLRFESWHCAPIAGHGPNAYIVKPGRLRARFGGTLKTRDIAQDLGVAQRTAQRILAEIGGRRVRGGMLMVRPDVYEEWKRRQALN